MLQPNRTFLASNNYRYGFNGKENDNEVKGEGNQQDYGMRIYDPRIGKFLSVDPIADEYPELTPYQFAADNPVISIDLDGLEQAYSYPINPNDPYSQRVYMPAGDNLPRKIPPEHLKYLPKASPDDGGTGTSLILDLLPVVGQVKGVIELYTGKDLITGDDLSGGQRALGALPFVKIGKVSKILKVEKAAAAAAKAEKAAVKVKKIVTPAEKAGNMVNKLKEVGKNRILQEGANLNKAGFKVEGQLTQIFNDKKLFTNWLKGNQSLSRTVTPLNAIEAQQIIDNAKKLGLQIESNLKGLQGLEKTGQWANIPHFKVGNVHIPIQQGLDGALKF